MYTEPFLMVPGSLESWDRGLSNDPGTIKNGSVYQKTWIDLCGALQQYYAPYAGAYIMVKGPIFRGPGPQMDQMFGFRALFIFIFENWD